MTSRELTRWPVLALQWAIPLLAACIMAGMTIPGSTVWPWNPNMIDLDVYRRTGTALLTGGDIFGGEGLPWIYPAFAALFTVPLTWPPCGWPACCGWPGRSPRWRRSGTGWGWRGGG